MRSALALLLILVLIVAPKLEAAPAGTYGTVLVTPPMTDGEPAAGRRVRQVAPEYEGTDVHHALYLPIDWSPGSLYPVVVEYTGNRWAACGSTGKVEDANLGYGMSGGRGFIWVTMPCVEEDRQKNAVTWWGDRRATVDYCKVNLPRICRAYGGDPAKVFICGFSRGAIGASYIGLADDEIASLWRGVFTHDHFDGQQEWPYPESDRTSALARLARLEGRPVLISGLGASRVRDDYLASHLDLAQFTFLDVPVQRFFDIPEGKVIHPHTDLWMHKDSIYRRQARAWIRDVLAAAPAGDAAHHRVPHPVLLSHPSQAAAGAEERTLYQLRDAHGHLVEYHLDVPSVVCGDSQCEIITTRLAWDPLGGYLRYDLPEGGELAKRGHKTFSPRDHEKLHRVLSTSDSILKNLDPLDVVSPAELQEGDEVDGVSGATLLQDESTIVTGAVYTCYTLWHWANGDVGEIIRDISGQEMSTGQLLAYLKDGPDERTAFAMDQLADREVHDAETVAFVLGWIRDGSGAVTESGLAYFESMGSEAYHAAIEKLFASALSGERSLLLKSLTATDLEPPPGFYTRLSSHLVDLDTYLEVHLLIGLLTYHGAADAEVVANAVRLLDHPSFLVARKATYFLDQQVLTADQEKIFVSFKEKHEGRF